MTRRIAINGFGRIGRGVLRVLLERDIDLEMIAVNDLTNGEMLAHLLEWDSVYGRLRRKISFADGELHVDDLRIKVFAEPDPSKLPWGELGIDVVLESTGRFTDAKDARRHIEAGAKRVLVSAPATEETAPRTVPVTCSTSSRTSLISSCTSLAPRSTEASVALIFSASSQMSLDSVPGSTSLMRTISVSLMLRTKSFCLSGNMLCTSSKAAMSDFSS